MEAIAEGQGMSPDQIRRAVQTALVSLIYIGSAIEACGTKDPTP